MKNATYTDIKNNFKMEKSSFHGKIQRRHNRNSDDIRGMRLCEFFMRYVHFTHQDNRNNHVVIYSLRNNNK